MLDPGQNFLTNRTDNRNASVSDYLGERFYELPFIWV